MYFLPQLKSYIDHSDKLEKPAEITNWQLPLESWAALLHSADFPVAHRVSHSTFFRKTASEVTCYSQINTL